MCHVPGVKCDALSFPCRYVAEDVDGSLTGNNGSAYVVVANDSQLLQPASQNNKACSLQPGWNAYACRGLCFRSVTVK